MRLLLLLLLPMVLSLFWLVIRQYVAMRLHERTRTIEAKVTDARSFPPGERGEAPTDDAPAASRPAGSKAKCGRHNVHLFLRLVGSEASCRQCAVIEDAEREAELAAAVDAAESVVRGNRKPPARG